MTIILYRKWESLHSCGLTLGKVSQRFINQTKSVLYPNLYSHTLHLSMNRDNLAAFYHLLGLLALEFAQPGVIDMIHFLSKLQDLAQDSSATLSPQHRVALHAIVAGLLFLLAKISPTSMLDEHVTDVVERRREIAPSLLPDALFAQDVEGADGVLTPEVSAMELPDQLLFHLRERGLDRQSPEPAENRRGRERVDHLTFWFILSLSLCLCLSFSLSLPFSQLPF